MRCHMTKIDQKLLNLGFDRMIKDMFKNVKLKWSRRQFNARTVCLRALC